jgi:hypothetical protein
MNLLPRALSKTLKLKPPRINGKGCDSYLKPELTLRPSPPSGEKKKPLPIKGINLHFSPI